MLADFRICISVPLNIQKIQQVFIFGLKEWKRHTYIYLWLTKALNFLAQSKNLERGEDMVFQNKSQKQ